MVFVFKFFLIYFSLVIKNVSNSYDGYIIPVTGCTKFNFYVPKNFNVTKISFKNSQVFIILFNENQQVKNLALFGYQINRDSMILCAWEYLEERGKIIIEMSYNKKKVERIINLYIGTFSF